MNSERKKLYFPRFLLMLAFYWVLVGVAGTAQASTYAYTNTTFSYDTPDANAITVPWHTGTTAATNGAPACTSYPLGDDDWAAITFASATTPANNFTFTFAGTVYSGLTIYSNGMLVFGTDTSGQWRTFTNATLPDATNIGTYTTGCPGGVLGNAIIPYWTDIVAGTGNSTTGASIEYELLGTAPNRRMVISWVNVKLYNQTARYNFQVALYESPSGGLNSNFKYQYTTGSSTGSAATVGVQISTADYTLYSYNQAFIDPVAGSAILWYPANQLDAVGAQYHFDEGTWTGAAGEVKDTSGSGQNAVKVGAATNVANGKVCRGGSFTANTSNTTIDAVSTPITPASVGSVDFWYNSNVKWNSANAMLFDATKTAANPFFLMKSATGALTFSVADNTSTVFTVSASAQTFALGTWHHVGVSWNLKPGTNQTLLQVFLDGVLNNSLRTTSSGVIGTMSNLFIGDNATSGVTPTGGSPNGANGFIDEVNVYALEINASQATSDMNATHSCASVDHFHVITAGSAVTCMATPVTIQAHDVNHNLIPLSGVTLSLTTTPGDGIWSNSAGGSINLITNNGGGSATYVFSNESQVTFNLQDTTAESLAIGATSGTVTTTSGSASSCVAADYTYSGGTTCNAALPFSKTGFIFSSALNGGVLTPATATPQIAGTSSPTYYLRAVTTSDNQTQACVGALTGATPVNFGYVCNNPATCSTGNFMSINGTPLIGASNRAGTTSNTSSVTMTFDANGNAPLTFDYSDAGQIYLYASKAASGLLTGPLTGLSAAPFVVRPNSFQLSAFPAAASGTVKAGNNFSTTVTAVTSGASPTTTPNFGNETIVETATLAPTLFLPPGMDTGTLGNAVLTFNNGVATATNLTWSEVGIIDLNATLTSGSYLGSGKTVTGTTGTSGAVGRFIPDHFTTTVTQGCTLGTNAFTYSGQQVATTITAQNLSGGTTVNYDGQNAISTDNFAQNVKLSDGNGSTNGTNDTWSPTSLLPSSFTKGVASPPLTVTLKNATTTPLTFALRVVDADNVTSAPTPGVEGFASMRSGRLRLSNNTGTMSATLSIPVLAQYWSPNSSWTLNSDDSCTTIPVASVAFSNYRNSSGGATNWTTSVNSGSAVALTNGKMNITLNPPSPANGVSGSVDLAVNLGTTTSDNACLSAIQPNTTGSNEAYLRGANGNCAAATTNPPSADPSATASFGIYTPENQKTVHVREIY